MRAALEKMSSLTGEDYDEIVFYGLNPWLYGIGDESLRQGKNPRWSCFDEGILSYETTFSIGKLDGIVGPLRLALGRYAITDLVSSYYCCFPELKENERHWDLRKVPPLSENATDLIDTLKHCFSYVDFPYHQRYIFFASSSDVDGNPFGETELVLKLAEIVGRENLLVKNASSRHEARLPGSRYRRDVRILYPVGSYAAMLGHVR